MKEAGINGFGRFGLHLLKYWLDRNEQSLFSLKYINDDYLDIDNVLEIINNDSNVIFNKYKIEKSKNGITVLEPNGNKHDIYYTNSPSNAIKWIGKPDIFFECSGKNTVSKKCASFINGKTNNVLISATSWDAEKTLVFGFNHEAFEKNDKIISYGTCTVNA